VTLTSPGAVNTANVAGSPYAITASNAVGGSFGANNYSITYRSGLLTINPATLTANLTGTTTKVYDGTTAALLSAGNYTLTGILNGDSVSLNDPAQGTYGTKNVGTGINVSVSGLLLTGPNAGNYDLQSTAISAAIGKITPATLTYVANPATDFLLGTPFPAFTGTVSGFVGGDTLGSSTTGTLAFATTATYASPPDVYAINGSGLTALNYVFSQAPSNATALVLGNPINIGTQPTAVGATPLPLSTPEARNAVDSGGMTPTAYVEQCVSSRPADVNAALLRGSGRAESTLGMGGFSVVYQTDFHDGHEVGVDSEENLNHTSSFIAFESHHRPAWCVRRPAGT
jgi:hypothetical protein